MPDTPLIDWPPFERAHRAFQKLWTKAAGNDGYDKQEWIALEQAIEDLARRARDAAR